MILDKNYKITQLIAKEITNSIDKKEHEELNEWINASESNKTYYKRIINPNNRQKRNEFVNTINIEKDLAKVKAKLQTKKSKKINLGIFYRVAAVITTGLFIYFTARYVSNDFNRMKKKYAENTIQVGSSKATLVLHNGKAIDLENAQNKIISEQDGTVINNSSGEIKYETKNITELKEIYNHAIIPRGGEFKINLSDGSKIQVNSASSLRYPVHFLKNKRIVYLDEGEAFFEVAEDEKRPFIVKTHNNLEIEALGTSFNVKSYKDENSITTLNSGKVKILVNKKEVYLTPDMQAIYNNSSCEIITQKVDAWKYSAWKDGIFVFDDVNLFEIGKVLSRWYDIEFFFSNEEIKNYHFTGDLERYEKPEVIFNMLEKASNVKFKIYEKSVLIEND